MKSADGFASSYPEFDELSDHEKDSSLQREVVRIAVEFHGTNNQRFEQTDQ